LFTCLKIEASNLKTNTLTEYSPFLGQMFIRLIFNYEIMNFKIALMYHDVYHSEVKESGFQNVGAIPYKITSHEFEHQISLIAEYCTSRQIDKNQVALTFDDGGESFHSIIAPVLEKHGFKGFFFITTGYIDSQGFMNKEQIIDLYNRGHYIGTHSHTHPKNISELSTADIESEWSKSVEILNRIISDKVKTASIPGGFYSEQSRLALKNNGIESIFTSVPTTKIKYHSDGQYIIGRFTIKNSTKSGTVLKFVNNNSVNQIYELIKWRGLAMIRSVLGNNYYRIREILLKIHKS
jgi:peptidoglycan/xylan/chitin deacetylase (PgdA/CDA1 family)